jgi:hypothetical protein
MICKLMIAAASAAVFMVSPAVLAQGQFGTADEAKAMLVKAAAAVKDGVIGRPSLWIAEDFRCCASG